MAPRNADGIQDGPAVDPAIEQFVVQFAKENRTWGYDRIVGALKNVGYTVSDQTVGNILKHHNLPPAPERKKTTTWRRVYSRPPGHFGRHGFLYHGSLDERVG